MHTCRWRLLEEILKWDCDVLVLQEVDHHHDWLSPMLAKEGYRSLFVKKPVAPGKEFNPHLEDGCSLFYRATIAPAAAVGTCGRDGGASTTVGAQGIDDQEAAKTTATATTEARPTLDLIDAHMFTLAIVEQEDETAEEENDDNDDNGQTKKPAGPVVGNQVVIISLLSVSSTSGGGDGGDRGETLVIVTTTHLKATKNGHGEMMRARQVSFDYLLHDKYHFECRMQNFRGRRFLRRVERHRNRCDGRDLVWS